MIGIGQQADHTLMILNQFLELVTTARNIEQHGKALLVLAGQLVRFVLECRDNCERNGRIATQVLDHRLGHVARAKNEYFFV